MTGKTSNGKATDQEQEGRLHLLWGGMHNNMAGPALERVPFVSFLVKAITNDLHLLLFAS